MRQTMRALRAFHGKRQIDVARALGVDRSTVSRMESGEIRTDPERLKEILDAIDTLGTPDPQVELLHDLEQDVEVLAAEAQILEDGITAAAQRIGRGQDVVVNARLVLHALRRTRAILAALRVRTEKPS